MAESNSTTTERESKAEQVSRVHQMLLDDGATWDLSDNDKAALCAVLDDREALLDALKAIISTLPENWGDVVHEGVVTPFHLVSDDVDDAIAAIAKAEGRS